MLNPLDNSEITRRELGQGIIEYALIAGGVSLAAAGAVGPVGDAINSAIGNAADTVNGNTDTFTVKFISEGVVFDQQMLHEGDTIVNPDTPTKDGDTFNGWSPELTEGMICTGNMMFQARWANAGDPGGTVEAITAADIDSIIDGGSPTGSRHMLLSSLQYWWSKVKAYFAPLVHTHGKDGIEDGAITDSKLEADLLARIVALEDARDSVSHEEIEGWNVYKFSNDLGYAIKNSNETVSTRTPWGALYYDGFSFYPPSIFAEVQDSSVKIKTGGGLWMTNVMNNSTERIDYYIMNPLKNVGQEVIMTFSVIGKLK